MAVGLNKSELLDVGASVLSATRSSTPQMSSGNVSASLSYSGKMSEQEILKSNSSSYFRILNGGLEGSLSIEDNAFIWGDNWAALHALLQSGVKAKLIYLDPPYSTGMDFQSRDQEYAYNDTLGDAAYIEFMRRRLVLMRELLDTTGSIYVHIGYQMVAELKLIMDEIFGRRNFRNIITRRKCSSKNFTRNQYSNLNDFVLFYSKSSDYVWNQPTQKPDPEWIAREYPKVDARGQYKLVPVHAPGVRRGETGTAWRGVMPPPGKHWQYAPSKLDAMDANGEIHWSKTGNPRRKVYLPDNKGLAFSDYWEQFRDAHHQSVLITGYPTEKNLEMLKMIVGASSNPGDLVLDPFCGSGSTLHAAEIMGRRWIGIDQSALAAKTVISRLSIGRKPMGDYVSKATTPDLFDNIEASTHELTGALFDVFVDAEMRRAFPADADEIVRLLKS